MQRTEDWLSACAKMPARTAKRWADSLVQSQEGANIAPAVAHARAACADHHQTLMPSSRCHSASQPKWRCLPQQCNHLQMCMHSPACHIASAGSEDRQDSCSMHSGRCKSGEPTCAKMLLTVLRTATTRTTSSCTASLCARRPSRAPTLKVAERSTWWWACRECRASCNSAALAAECLQALLDTRGCRQLVLQKQKQAGALSQQPQGLQ